MGFFILFLFFDKIYHQLSQVLSQLAGVTNGCASAAKRMASSWCGSRNLVCEFPLPVWC